MALGPGKYDALATYVREHAQAAAVVVAVIEGNLGSGVSVQTEAGAAFGLPALLRTIADQIEADRQRARIKPENAMTFEDACYYWCRSDDGEYFVVFFQDNPRRWYACGVHVALNIGDGPFRESQVVCRIMEPVS